MAFGSATRTHDEGRRLLRLRLKTSSLPKGSEGIYFGYRAWGPNWTFDPAWSPGSHAGFLAEVFGRGNNFNPNKLLLDP